MAAEHACPSSEELRRPPVWALRTRRKIAAGTELTTDDVECFLMNPEDIPPGWVPKKPTVAEIRDMLMSNPPPGFTTNRTRTVASDERS